MILLVGATGLVGSATLRQLTARGVPVRALVRSAEKASTLAGRGVETVIGDLEQPASLDAALDSVTRAADFDAFAREHAALFRGG
jgi:uncharacterized protein YbjT (DUF2867 family)